MVLTHRFAIFSLASIHPVNEEGNQNGPNLPSSKTFSAGDSFFVAKRRPHAHVLRLRRVFDSLGVSELS